MKNGLDRAIGEGVCRRLDEDHKLAEKLNESLAHLHAHTFDAVTPIPHMFQASSQPKGKREQDLTAGSQVDDSQRRWWLFLERTTQRCASLLRKGAGRAMLVRRACRPLAIVPDPARPSPPLRAPMWLLAHIAAAPQSGPK